MLVEIFGHQSCIASTGREALVRAVEFVPEIVILDLGLPDLCGYDVARELRLRVNQPMFIAALTGWGSARDRMRCVAAGFDDHVLKPADGAKLREILRRADRRLGGELMARLHPREEQAPRWGSR